VNITKKIFIAIGFILVGHSTHLHAQKHNYGVLFSPRVGYLMPHRSTMAHLVRHHAFGAELSAVLQTNGEKQWHHDFNFPEISLGLFYGDLGNREILGHAVGLTGGIYLPFFKKNGWSLGTDLEVGLGYVTKHYDVETNPKNNAIGSHVNCIVGFGLQFEKKFVQHALGLKVSMTHLSNGAFRLPNLGVNLPFVALNYTYYIKPLKTYNEATVQREGQAMKTWEFYTQLIGSAKQIYPTGGSTYGVLALTNYTHYKAKNKCILEAGVDVIYNESIVKYNQGDHGKEKNLQVGLYGAYVLPIHRFQILLGMGRYLHNPLDPAGMWYHKFGSRFQILDRLWANISIKSHWAKADYFEYGLTFRW
jgi:hypothetical protein